MARSKKLTKEQEEQVTRLIELQIPKTVISRHYGVSNSLINSIQSMRHIKPMDLTAILKLVDHLTTNPTTKEIIKHHEYQYKQDRQKHMAKEASKLQQALDYPQQTQQSQTQACA